MALHIFREMHDFQPGFSKKDTIRFFLRSLFSAFSLGSCLPQHAVLSFTFFPGRRSARAWEPFVSFFRDNRRALLLLLWQVGVPIDAFIQRQHTFLLPLSAGRWSGRVLLSSFFPGQDTYARVHRWFAASFFRSLEKGTGFSLFRHDFLLATVAGAALAAWTRQVFFHPPLIASLLGKNNGLGFCEFYFTGYSFFFCPPPDA